MWIYVLVSVVSLLSLSLGGVCCVVVPPVLVLLEGRELLELLELYQFHWRDLFFIPPTTSTNWGDNNWIFLFIIYFPLHMVLSQKLISPNSIYLILPDFLSLIKMENQQCKINFKWNCQWQNIQTFRRKYWAIPVWFPVRERYFK